MVCAILLAGCYSEKKAVRQVGKAQAYYPSVTADFCARTHPIAEFIRDSFIYLQGEPELIIDTMTKSDTVEHYVTRYITKTVKVTDTVYKSRENAKESTAKLEAQRLAFDKKIAEAHDKAEKMYEAFDKLQSKYDKRVARDNIIITGLSILAAYTILRWVFKAIFKFNLP
jgi:hypothetical protein